MGHPEAIIQGILALSDHHLDGIYGGCLEKWRDRAVEHGHAADRLILLRNEAAAGPDTTSGGDDDSCGSHSVPALGSPVVFPYHALAAPCQPLAGA
jgi:hypothetical protein